MKHGIGGLWRFDLCGIGTTGFGADMVDVCKATLTDALDYLVVASEI